MLVPLERAFFVGDVESIGFDDDGFLANSKKYW
jgi:hypothetical protein